MEVIEVIKKQLKHTLNDVKFNLEGEYYKGKVRDNYFSGDKITMITSDRVSAFDHVLGTIPFKGKILTELMGVHYGKKFFNHLVA